MSSISLPNYNNRDASFALEQVAGQTALVYQLRGGKAFSDHVLEAARTMAAHPCALTPRVYEVTPTRIVAEYLHDFTPLGKIGLTSTCHGLARLTGKPGRFKRYHLRATLRHAREHMEELITQLRQFAGYLERQGLWHEDLMPQNVMWRNRDCAIRVVDIAAFVPRRLLGEGRLPYIRGRTRGALRPDYTIDTDFVRDVFFADMAPLPLILLRKWHLLRGLAAATLVAHGPCEVEALLALAGIGL